MNIVESETGKKVETLRVLNLLARGIHPANGEMLDDEGCWNHPCVIRALLFAADFLSEMRPTSQREEKSKPLQDRSGKAWSPQEDSELRIGFERQRLCSTCPIVIKDQEGQSSRESPILA
jgi:hypothetical protein